jgi:hypothetical protein
MVSRLPSAIQIIKRMFCKHYSHYYFDGKDVRCPNCNKSIAEVTMYIGDIKDIVITFDKDGKARW